MIHSYICTIYRYTACSVTNTKEEDGIGRKSGQGRKEDDENPKRINIEPFTHEVNLLANDEYQNPKWDFFSFFWFSNNEC